MRALSALRRDAGSDACRASGDAGSRLRRGWTGRPCRPRCRPGAARNALDCALLDLEAKRAGQRAWNLLGRPAPRPCTTAYTISLGTPDAMAAATAKAAHRPLLKIKLGGDGDRRADRGGAQGRARIRTDRRRQRGLDAGQSRDTTSPPAPTPASRWSSSRCRPAGTRRWRASAARSRSAPTKACMTAPRSTALRGRYDAVNIKLDKTGGLTEALAMADAAHALGFEIMIGCMVATSLAMAPAMLLAPQAAIRRSRRPAAAGARPRRRAAL